MAAHHLEVCMKLSRGGPLQKQPSHPDNAARDHQPSNSVENTAGGGPPEYHTPGHMAGGGSLHGPQESVPGSAQPTKQLGKEESQVKTRWTV